MQGVNKFIGIGNLTRDPEVRKTPNGNSVASFSIAINEKYKDKQGVLQEKCEYVNIVVWGKVADLCGQYLSKGKPVYLEGKITTRSWEDQSGQKKYMTEIVANTVQFLGGGQQQNQAPQQQYSQQQQYNQNQQGFQAPPEPIIEQELPF
jgi:single-strand DNA-binding protein